VELETKGVRVSPDNELMKGCGAYFQEALKLGKTVKHYSRHEGVDESIPEPGTSLLLGGYPVEIVQTAGRMLPPANTFRPRYIGTSNGTVY